MLNFDHIEAYLGADSGVDDEPADHGELRSDLRRVRDVLFITAAAFGWLR